MAAFANCIITWSQVYPKPVYEHLHKYLKRYKDFMIQKANTSMQQLWGTMPSVKQIYTSCRNCFTLLLAAIPSPSNVQNIGATVILESLVNPVNIYAIVPMKTATPT